MNSKNQLLYASIIASVLLTASCSDIKKDLGIARNSPDEFTVVKRAPLSLPPEYNLVPPLKKGETSDVVENKSTTTKAKEVLFGEIENNENLNEGDKTFLTKLKVEDAKDDIRKLIDEDNGYLYIKNKSVIDKLLNSEEKAPSPDEIPSSTVDAKKEAERIKENLENDKPINEGEVPVIEKKESTIEKLF